MISITISSLLHLVYGIFLGFVLGALVMITIYNYKNK